MSWENLTLRPSPKLSSISLKREKKWKEIKKDRKELKIT